MGMIDLGTPYGARPENMTKNIRIKGKKCVAYIFCDNYPYIVSLFNEKRQDGSRRLRPCCFDQVQKTILCGSMDLGYSVYECPSCGNYTIIPNTCKSRFCTGCGVKAARMRAAEISAMALDCPHRHIVFTIPKELRVYFAKKRSRLNLLFVASRNTLADVANSRKYRKEKRKRKGHRKRKERKTLYDCKDSRDRITVGSVMTLHTFGRSLDFNPHIHALVCEEAHDRSKDRMKTLYFPYEKLRKTFQYQLLTLLSRDEELRSDPEFGKLKSRLYKEKRNGFYVYAPPMSDDNDDENNDLSDDLKAVVSYIIRYTSRPAMAESRIDSYEDNTKMVTYHYNDHKDNSYVEVCEHAHIFIRKLLWHCPDANFRMIRYYGFYSTRAAGQLDHIYELYGQKRKRRLRNRAQRKKKADAEKKTYRFRYRMIADFNRDPIKCRCGCIMNHACDYDPFKKLPADCRELVLRDYRNSCININRRLAGMT